MTIKEKRGAHRINSLNLLNYICLDEDKDFVHHGMGRTLNVSQTGILLESNFFLKPRFRLILKIELLDELVDVKGTVVFCHRGDDGNFEAGIRFIDLDERAHNAMREFIRAYRDVVYYERQASENPVDAGKVPFIKGPLFDYSYVADEEKYKEGDQIVEEGSFGTWLWVVLEGAVDIIKSTRQGPVKIARIGDGAFIGSLATFLSRDNVRSATAVAVGDVQLGIIDFERLRKEYLQFSSGFKGLLTCLDRRLRQVSELAAGCSPEKWCQAGFFEERNPLFRQGHKVDQFYQIEKGNAYIVRSTQDGAIGLAVLDEGDLFGDIAFLDLGQELKNAAVYGSEDLEYQAVAIKALKQEFNSCSMTMRNLIRNIAAYIAATSETATRFQINARRNEPSY